MFKFEHIEYLYLLWLIPVMIVIYIMMLRWRKKAFIRFSELNLLQQIMPNLSERKTRLKVWLQIIAFALIIVAIANPQIGSKLEEVKREGIDIMIALDVSNSMNAEDLQPNRLERAKQIITKIVDKLKGDRIGIIVFAGEAYIQLPITSDYAAAKLFLNTINTGYIPTQGTAIGNAIDLATKALTAREEKKHRSKVILVITDGENHEDDAISAAKNASENGIIIHTMGFGSPNGVPIPVYKNNKMVGYKTDKDGNTIITKLNESLLQQIASIGNGIYIRGTNSNASLNSFLDEINKLEKTELASQIFTEYESRFQYLIALALILLTIEYFIPRIKSKWIAQINLFDNKKMRNYLFIVTFVLSNLLSLAQQENKFIREGNKLYKENKFVEAEQNYLKAIEKNANNNISNYNLGNAFYKQNKFDEALQQYNTFVNTVNDKEKQAKAYHNIGNAYLKTEKLEEAVKAYKQSLKLNPKDEDTRYNLAYALEKLKQQQQQQNQNQQQQQQNKQEEKKEEQKQEQKNQEQQQQQQNQMSKEEAKRMLEALQNEEKNTQEKRDKRKEAVKVQIEKDW